MRQSPIKSQPTLKQLTLDTIMQFYKLLGSALQIIKNDLIGIGWNNEELQQSKSPILENAKVLGWLYHDKLISQITLYPIQMNIYSTTFEMG